MNDTPRPSPTTNTLAIVSLVFGALAWTLLPLVGAIVAIVTGHMARGELRRQPAGGPLRPATAWPSPGWCWAGCNWP
jgi:hypothetical protein